MFRLTKKKIVEWPVSIPDPQDGGRVKHHESSAQFELIVQSEFDAIYAAGGNDTDMLMRCVVGWPESRWVDEDGNPMPCTEENKRKLFDDPLVRAAFVRAVLDLRTGREAQRKN